MNSRLVFVTNSNHLYAIERRTGRVVWVTDLGVLPTSSTACDEQQVMVGLTNGKLGLHTCFTTSRDKKKTLYAMPRRWLELADGGRGAMTSRPLPAQQFVAFGGQDGKLYVALSECRAT